MGPGAKWGQALESQQHWTALGPDSVRPNYVTAKLVEEVLIQAELTMASAKEKQWQQQDQLEASDQ